MRTVSYILIKDPSGEIRGSASLRGALSYTGRVLLQQFKSNDRVERLVAEGPIDMIGYFPEECEGMRNPAVIKQAKSDQANRLPKVFRQGVASFESLEQLNTLTKNHNHLGTVNFFIFDEGDWYYAKHTLKDIVKLTMNIVDFDDEDHG